MTARWLNLTAAAILVALALLVAGVTGAQAREDLSASQMIPYEQAQAVAGEIIVKFKPGAPPAAVDAINRGHGAAMIYRSPFAGFLRLRLRPGRSVAQAVAAYRRHGEVEYAEPNFVRSALGFPNDPYYPYQWHLDDSTTPNPYGGANGGGINLGPAWAISTGAGAVVAVIDTGIAYEDYSERIGNRRKTYYRAPDLDPMTFVQGYDYVNNDSHPNDDNSHGTHVAGTIAQSTNNGLGTAGVAFDAKLMPVKVLDGNGFGTDADIADGIYYAADHGAKVLNLSLGGPGTSSTLENAVAYAYGAGATVVCAAGNGGDKSNLPSYPAAYDDYCIAVAATRYDETRAYYSNYGSYVDLAAPGGDLNVDQNGDGYGDGVLQNTFNPNTKNTGSFGYWFFSGTSMATPHVSGVAALLIANGVTDPDGVREALEMTAEDKGPAGWDQQYGWGIVDAYAALSYEFAPVHDVAVTDLNAPGSAVQGDVAVQVSVTDRGDDSESFGVTLTDTTDNVVIGSQNVAGLPPGQSQALSFTWHAESASPGDHLLKAEAGPVAGETKVADNVRTAPVTILPAGRSLHVADIGMALKRGGVNTSALATVTIRDGNGYPVAGASVSGHWSEATGDRDVGLTNASGRVTLQSNSVKRAARGITFTFTVDNASLAGWSYDPAANLETSDSISVP